MIQTVFFVPSNPTLHGLVALPIIHGLITTCGLLYGPWWNITVYSQAVCTPVLHDTPLKAAKTEKSARTFSLVVPLFVNGFLRFSKCFFLRDFQRTAKIVKNPFTNNEMTSKNVSAVFSVLATLRGRCTYKHLGKARFLFCT